MSREERQKATSDTYRKNMETIKWNSSKEEYRPKVRKNLVKKGGEYVEPDSKK